MKRRGFLYLFGYGVALFGVWLNLLLPVANAVASDRAAPDSWVFACGWLTAPTAQFDTEPVNSRPTGSDELCSLCLAACSAAFLAGDGVPEPTAMRSWVVRSAISHPGRAQRTPSVYRVLNRGPPVA